MYLCINKDIKFYYCIKLLIYKLLLKIFLEPTRTKLTYESINLLT